MVDALFLSILNMSLFASYAIIFVLLARLFLKKAPKIFSYALWSVVLFRLLCPLSFESKLSLIPIEEQPISQEIIYSQTPQISTGMPFVDNMINPILPVPTTIGTSINPIQVWLFIGEIIWVLGIIIMVLYSIISFIKLKRSLISSMPLKENIYLTDHISTPFVLGVKKPKVYLPSTLFENEQNYIICHELCHIKRFDHITRLLGFIALIIHWFNPLVWVAFIVSGKDMEIACDEMVMKSTEGEVKVEYSQSLLRLATSKKMIYPLSFAFREGDIKARIKNIINYKKPKTWIVLITFILCMMMIFSLVSNPTERTVSNPSTQEHVMEIDNREPFISKIVKGVVDTTINNKDLSEEIVMKASTISATWEGVNIDTLDDYYHIHYPIAEDSTIKDYYAFLLDNKPVLQYGKDGRLVKLHDELYGKLEDIFFKPLTIDQAVIKALFAQNRYLRAECFGEGHIILGTKQDSKAITIYTLTMIGEYGFVNNNFEKVSGTGIIPAVVTLKNNNEVTIEYPEDGSRNAPSIKAMFPRKYQSRVFGENDRDREELEKQERTYAREYLSKIGRQAKIGNYRDFEHTLLTSVGVSVEVSNGLEDFYKKEKAHNYPRFIGTQEVIEEGERMVYEMKYEQNQQEIIFTKYFYNSKEIVEQYLFSATTGKQIAP